MITIMDLVNIYMKDIITDAWGGNPLSTYPRWEQREILSYQNIDRLATDNTDRINQIVDATCSEENMSWKADDLSLIDEALIQRLLRINGMEMLCDGLDVFPLSSKALRAVTYMAPTANRIRDKWNLKLAPTLRNILASVGRWLSYEFMLTLVVLAGLAYYQFDLILISLLTAMVTANLAVSVTHYHWSHRLIQPRNKYLGYLFDLWAYLVTNDPIAIWTQGHRHHHRHRHGVPDAQHFDLTTLSWWRYLLKFGYRENTALSDWMKSSEYEREGLENYHELDSTQRWMTDNLKLIKWSVHVSLMMLSLKYYLYFMLVPMLYYRLAIIFCTDVIPHSWMGDRSSAAWTFPLCFENYLHNPHHESPGKLHFGPWFARIINPNYWFIRAFYRTKVDITR